jgi:hypothetical protein
MKKKSDEENFDEAVAQVFKAYQRTTVRLNLLINVHLITFSGSPKRQGAVFRSILRQPYALS